MTGIVWNIYQLLGNKCLKICVFYILVTHILPPIFATE